MEDIVLSRIKAIILAAGRGTRISKDIGDIPKSLLKINGKSVIRYTAELLQKKNIEIIVCTGYRHRLIQEALNELDVRYYYNPFYEVCNNIGSLWFAQEEFSDDSKVIIISADVIMEEELLDKIIHSIEHGMIMFGDKNRILDGDYFLREEENRIVEFGPDIVVAERDYEYICVSAIAEDVQELFRERLNAMIEDGCIKDYYENVLFSFIGTPDIGPTCVDITGTKWHEIDRIEDYYIATEKFE